MRQTSKTRRTIGIRGQLMGFLCFICLLLVGLFWFLSTQLLEPLYTTHIQKQLTEQEQTLARLRTAYHQHSGSDADLTEMILQLERELPAARKALRALAQEIRQLERPHR